MNLIFICGNASAGKDTLFRCLESILKDIVICERFALADELKLKINPFTKEHFNISAFTKNPEEKNLIRPLMVEVAEIFRIISKGTYWTSLLQPKIEESIRNGNLPVITDGRFSEYPFDEVWWAKTKNSGTSIFVTRFDENGCEIPPANHKERNNEKILRETADFCVKWPTSNNFDYLCDLVKFQLNELILEICQKYERNLTNN